MFIGHYTCYTKRGDLMYYEYDDKNVAAKTFRQVQQLAAKNSAMLLYAVVAGNTHSALFISLYMPCVT